MRLLLMPVALTAELLEVGGIISEATLVALLELTRRSTSPRGVPIESSAKVAVVAIAFLARFHGFRLGRVLRRVLRRVPGVRLACSWWWWRSSRWPVGVGSLSSSGFVVWWGSPRCLVLAQLMGEHGNSGCLR